MENEQQHEAEASDQCAMQGRIIVQCERAEGLPKMDTYTQKADPYLVVTVTNKTTTGVAGSRQQKTSICKNTLKPVWKEALSFEEVMSDAEVRVEMFDHEKMGQDRSMGSFCVCASSVCPGSGSQAFQLKGTLFDKRPAVGSVYLSLAFTPTVMPSQEASVGIKERGELGIGGEKQEQEAAAAPPLPPSPPRHSNTKEEELYIEAITKEENSSQASPSDVTGANDWAAVHAELLQMVSREDKRAASKRLAKSRHTVPWVRAFVNVVSL